MLTRLVSPAASIGALMYEDNLTLVDTASGPVYNIVPGKLYVGDTLDEFMARIATQTLPGNALRPERPRISQGYKFAKSKVIANASSFYIGNGLLVTAGHCVAEDDTEKLDKAVMSMKIVFGLTQIDVERKFIPANRVFGIERYVRLHLTSLSLLIQG